mmetsp:Transcript_26001/g.59817  ORF Transcript_26001/g.59817 Transcript_26001/m.59817 type:complete len:363 (-) Transcript_26001:319-1407(-)
MSLRRGGPAAPHPLPPAGGGPLPTCGGGDRPLRALLRRTLGAGPGGHGGPPLAHRLRATIRTPGPAGGRRRLRGRPAEGGARRADRAEDPARERGAGQGGRLSHPVRVRPATLPGGGGGTEPHRHQNLRCRRRMDAYVQRGGLCGGAKRRTAGRRGRRGRLGRMCIVRRVAQRHGGGRRREGAGRGGNGGVVDMWTGDDVFPTTYAEDAVGHFLDRSRGTWGGYHSAENVEGWTKIFAKFNFERDGKEGTMDGALSVLRCLHVETDKVGCLKTIQYCLDKRRESERSRSCRHIMPRFSTKCRVSLPPNRPQGRTPQVPLLPRLCLRLHLPTLTPNQPPHGIRLRVQGAPRPPRRRRRRCRAP